MITPQTAPRVLVVENDLAIAAAVTVLLQDEGYLVTWRRLLPPVSLLTLVMELRPACVLLAESAKGDYGAGWTVAAALAARMPPVPVIMFTTNIRDFQEAVTHRSVRSQGAAFSATVRKPFDADALLAAVAHATDTGRPLSHWSIWGCRRLVRAVLTGSDG